MESEGIQGEVGAYLEWSVGIFIIIVAVLKAVLI